MRARIGRLILKLGGWRAVGERPEPHKFVAVCAPHTSNWDYIIMLAVSWTMGFSLAFLGKEEMFRPPIGWFTRWSGGIAVDRSSPQGLVGQMADEFAARSELVLAIPPEATRSQTDYWKSGFYRIAEKANVPYVLTYVDAATKTAGFGPEITPSGNIVADMDIAREFYADKVAIYPANVGPIKLRDEEADETRHSA